MSRTAKNRNRLTTFFFQTLATCILKTIVFEMFPAKLKLKGHPSELSMVLEYCVGNAYVPAAIVISV